MGKKKKKKKEITIQIKLKEAAIDHSGFSDQIFSAPQGFVSPRWLYKPSTEFKMFIYIYILIYFELIFFYI